MGDFHSQCKYASHNTGIYKLLSKCKMLVLSCQFVSKIINVRDF